MLVLLLYLHYYDTSMLLFSTLCTITGVWKSAILNNPRVKRVKPAHLFFLVVMDAMIFIVEANKSQRLLPVRDLLKRCLDGIYLIRIC